MLLRSHGKSNLTQSHYREGFWEEGQIRYVELIFNDLLILEKKSWRGLALQTAVNLSFENEKF